MLYPRSGTSDPQRDCNAKIQGALEDKAAAEKLNEFFALLFTLENARFPHLTGDKFTQNKVSVEEVIDKTHKLNSGKS